MLITLGKTMYDLQEQFYQVMTRLRPQKTNLQFLWKDSIKSVT